MSDTVIVALISAGASALVAVTALVLNYRGFATIDARLLAIDQRVHDLTGAINEIDKRLTRVEIKLNIQP